MSYQGMKIAADVLAHMQTASIELIRLGAADLKSEAGKQDILLGRMFNDDKGIEVIKKRFTKLTQMKVAATPNTPAPAQS